MPTFYGVPSDGSVIPEQLEVELDARFTPRADVPTSAVAVGLFDPVRSLYNFKPEQLDRARAALGKSFAGTGEARIAFLGDSTTAGVGASGQNWPALLVSRLLAAGHKSTGTGVVGAYKSSGDDPRWVKGAGWGAMSSVTTMITNSTTNTAATFTSDVPGTIARVHYSQRSSSPFTVSIDGGAPVTVTANGTTNAPAVYQVTGLANTTHTITITRVATDTKYVQVFGAEVATSNNGIRTYNAGIGGGKVPTSGQVGWWAVDQYSTASTGFNADLAFVMYQTNDAGSGTALSDYKAALSGMLANMKAAGSSVVLVTAVPTDLSAYTTPGDMSDYTAAMYELADQHDLPLIDLQHRMVSYERTSSFGLMTDRLHPNAAGYATVSGAVAAALGL